MKSLLVASMLGAFVGLGEALKILPSLDAYSFFAGVFVTIIAKIVNND